MSLKNNNCYTIKYHADDATNESSKTTSVVYGVKTKTLTIKELAFSKTGKDFAGWRAYRDVDDKWYVIGVNGKASWVKLTDGKLPSGSRFYTYKDGHSVAKTAHSGTVHFYAQWKDDPLTELKNKYNDLETKFACEVASSKLRNISNNIKKKKRVVFIGTGKLGENTQYAYIHLNRMIQNEGLTDIESLYFARNKIEKEYFDSLGLPCEIWSSQNYSHILYALQAKVALFSTHTRANVESNSILLSCLSGAYRIQLWHGFLAKTVGCALLKDGTPMERMVHMLEDCSVNVVTASLNSKDVIGNYEESFPGADVICTGDARMDVLSHDIKNEAIDKWCVSNKEKIKLLFSPTYRESPGNALAYVKSFIELCEKIDKTQIAISIKFHPVFFTKQKIVSERTDIIKQIEGVGVNVVSEREDSYTIMNKFDAMVTDYSSIRLDFALTGKPIILFRPDYSQYTAKRIINPMPEFDLLDSVSYDMEKDDIIDAIKKDSKRNDRLEVVKKIGLYTDGKNAERVCSIILSNIQ